MKAKLLADRLLAWFDAHGRMSLPWQQDPHPVSGMGLRSHAAADPGRDRDSRTTSVSWRAFPTSRRSPPRRWMRCCTCGRGSGTTRAPRNLQRCAQCASASATAGDFPTDLRGGDGTARHRPLDCRCHPRARAAVSAMPSSMATPSACWRAYSASRAIRAARRCSRHCGQRRKHCTPRRASSRAIRRRSWISAPRVCMRRNPRARCVPLGADCRRAREGRQPELPAAQARRAAAAREAVFLVAETGEEAGGGAARAPSRERASGAGCGARRNSRAKPAALHRAVRELGASRPEALATARARLHALRPALDSRCSCAAPRQRVWCARRMTRLWYALRSPAHGGLARTDHDAAVGTRSASFPPPARVRKRSLAWHVRCSVCC